MRTHFEASAVRPPDRDEFLERLGILGSIYSSFKQLHELEERPGVVGPAEALLIERREALRSC